MNYIKKINYNTDKYNFASKVKNIFNVKNLGMLHTKLPKNIQYNDLHRVGEDSKTWYHKEFYTPINEGNREIIDLYENFIKNEVSKILDFDVFLFQAIPTFRVHTPNNIAVGGWHRDRDYNHSTHEINFYMPLNLAKGSSTIWSESVEGKEDYSPINGDFGDLIMWNGANLKHGNVRNNTDRTRVSLDFRVLELSKYQENETRKTISTGRALVLGDYFKLNGVKK